VTEVSLTAHLDSALLAGSVSLAQESLISTLLSPVTTLWRELLKWLSVPLRPINLSTTKIRA